MPVLRALSETRLSLVTRNRAKPTPLFLQGGSEVTDCRTKCIRKPVLFADYYNCLTVSARLCFRLDQVSSKNERQKSCFANQLTIDRFISFCTVQHTHVLTEPVCLYLVNTWLPVRGSALRLTIALEFFLLFLYARILYVFSALLEQSMYVCMIILGVSTTGRRVA